MEINWGILFFFSIIQQCELYEDCPMRKLNISFILKNLWWWRLTLPGVVMWRSGVVVVVVGQHQHACHLVVVGRVDVFVDTVSC